MPISVIAEKKDQHPVAVLHEVGQILGMTTDFEGALNDILRILCDRLEMRLGTLSLLHNEDGEVTIDLAYGLSKSEIERGRYKIGEGITGKVVESGKPVIVPRISSEPLFLNRTGARGRTAKSQTSFICVPILLQKRVVGTLSADTPYQNDAVLQEKVQLLSIVAAMVSQAVASRWRARQENTRLLDENQRLHKQLRERFQPANIIGNSRPMQEVADLIRQHAAQGTPIRAVMLPRLGPNVWHDSPAAAMATIEELEETARLMLLQPHTPPLGSSDLDELRQIFGARW